MMEAIAGAAMDMKSAQLAADYSIAVTKKVMDTQELAAQEMLNMLPATPPKSPRPERRCPRPRRRP